jgi:hypothetical protein
VQITAAYVQRMSPRTDGISLAFGTGNLRKNYT